MFFLHQVELCCSAESLLAILQLARVYRRNTVLYRPARRSGLSSIGVDRRAARWRGLVSSRGDRPREGKTGSARTGPVARRTLRATSWPGARGRKSLLLHVRFVSEAKRNTAAARDSSRLGHNYSTPSHSKGSPRQIQRRDHPIGEHRQHRHPSPAAPLSLPPDVTGLVPAGT